MREKLMPERLRLSRGLHHARSLKCSRIGRLERQLQSSGSFLRGLSVARPTVFREARGQETLDSLTYADLFWDEA